MTILSAISSSSLLPTRPLSTTSLSHQQFLSNNFYRHGNLHKPISSFKIKAAKLPPGVQMPKVEPKLTAPFLGFTETAEIWNSRACMIGLIGTFIVELIFHRGILQIIGVDVGKGLDIPL
ncbi:light-harvesting complex-like protein OHP1, chloroplastic [Cinnamomum micranthum f. kanehirae]|uniref:Light-harvesting complex-like protein OHP1, chloroplastic n=1 Tax=Cinnamomum micranthum f. kanehirae TaxID=337451 RepID=A0A3S3MXT4_9MAGN|nr:light-harvesting complex-like protein OHP1, chloroplastic [Cinnamomum micranthum f. kanehirae]